MSGRGRCKQRLRDLPSFGPECPLALLAFSEISKVDFIEKHLGFSPDHGDGSFEAMLLMVVVTIITGIAVRFFRRQHVRK